MHAANRAFLTLLALAAAGCGRHDARATNEASATNTGMDVETLPPDESDATPTNELENGVDEPTGNTADLNSD
jgi:hypothetical protein